MRLSAQSSLGVQTPAVAAARGHGSGRHQRQIRAGSGQNRGKFCYPHNFWDGTTALFPTSHQTQNTRQISFPIKPPQASVIRGGIGDGIVMSSLVQHNSEVNKA